MGAMNKLQHTLSFLALSFAIGVIGLEAWKTGVIQIDTNAEFSCAINGIEQEAHGTRVKVNMRSTQIVWMTCNDKTINSL